MTITQARTTPRPSTTGKLWCWACLPPSRLVIPDDPHLIKLNDLEDRTIGMAIATGQHPNGQTWFRIHISNTSSGRETAQLIADNILDRAHAYTSFGRRLTTIAISPNDGPIDIGPNQQAIDRRHALEHLATLDH